MVDRQHLNMFIHYATFKEIYTSKIHIHMNLTGFFLPALRTPTELSTFPVYIQGGEGGVSPSPHILALLVCEARSSTQRTGENTP
jgi:hypothetical protein